MYAQLTDIEIKTLSENKASGSAWAVYTALAAHSWKSAQVFPSIDRIRKVLGGHYSKRTIYQALRFLDKVGLIIRKAATVKERFTLALKKAAKKLKHGAVSSLQDPAHDCTNVQHKREQKRKNNNYYSNYKKKKKAINQFQAINQDHRTDETNWLDLAASYCLGDTNVIPIPKCKKKAAEALNDKTNAISSFYGDMIRSKLGHLLVQDQGQHAY